MSIRFEQVIPIPLEEEISHSEIWSVNIEIPKGQVILVKAPSGKGKSTFLHCIYGLRNDYRGNIRLDGNLMNGIHHSTLGMLRQNTISIVFQDLRLFHELSAMENIQLKNRLTNHKSEAEIILMADKLGMKGFLNKPAGELSYGQQQRIAILRSLCQPFAYLLLDEPFSHLDNDNLEAARDLIIEEAEMQKALCLFTSLGEQYGLIPEMTLVL